MTTVRSLVGNEYCVGPQRARGLSNVRLFGNEIVESSLDVFREGAKAIKRVSKWMRGTERRCMDEYALAVKGGRIAYGGLHRCVCVGSSVCCLTDDCGGAIDSIVWVLAGQF